MNRIPFNKPFIIGRELSLIADAVARGHLSGDGPYTRLCHQWLESRLDCRKALLTHSCTGALEMAAILCGVGPGDEVIMPSYTFVSTANAFVLRGAVPVFVDIRPDTLNLDESRVAKAITGKTRVIVPVHYAGVPCAMDRIMDLAARNGCRVVEDAAQALLTGFEGKSLGTIGHLGCLSFHETKNIISGEGGALLINDGELAERAEIIREKGTDRSRYFRGEVDKYTWVDIGSSYLPGELVSAFLYAQLERADEIVSRRRALVAAYASRLARVEQAGHLEIRPCVREGNGHMFYVLLKDGETRGRLIDHLKSRDILSVFHYVPLHSSPAGRRFGRVEGTMRHTDELAARLLRLPLYYDMSAVDVDQVCGAVEAFFGR